MNSKKFVDREIPFKLFENNLKYIRSSNSNNGILYYWGVGGSGKSTFLSRIKNHCVDNKIIYTSYNYADADYYSVIDLVRYIQNDILNNSYTNVINEPLFIRFEKALCLYYAKYKNKDHLLFGYESNKQQNGISLLTDVAKLLIPGSVSNVINKGKAIIQAAIKIEENVSYKIKHDRFIEDFNKMDDLFNDDFSTQDSLVENVIDNFVLDYNDYVDALKTNNLYNSPLVIALDTIERLIEEYYDKSNKNNSEVDYKRWIVGKNGFIFRLKDTIVILTGRDQIIDVNSNYCDIYDSKEDGLVDLYKGSKNFDSSLEHYTYDINNHIDIFEKGKVLLKTKNVIYCYKLDSIKEEYIYELLENMNITDKNIQKQIYAVSSGFPMYVRLCVDEYTNTIADGKTPTIDDYEGKLSDFIPRLFASFSDDEKTTLYILALLQRWQDDEIEIINNHDDSKMYTYEKIKKNSFITKDGKDRYIFHRVVRETLLSDEDLSSRFSSIVEKISSLYMTHPELIKNLYQVSRLSDISKMPKAKNNSDILMKITQAHESIDPNVLISNNQYYYDVSTDVIDCITDQMLSSVKEGLLRFDQYEYLINDEINNDMKIEDYDQGTIDFYKEQSEQLLNYYEYEETDKNYANDLVMVCAYYQLKKNYSKASKYYRFLLNYLDYFNNEVKKPLVSNDGYDKYVICTMDCLMAAGLYNETYDVSKRINTENLFYANLKVQALNKLLNESSIDEEKIKLYMKEKKELESKFHIY